MGSSQLCVECEDMEASLMCDQCGDAFCTLCFSWQHQKGTRATHSTTSIETIGATRTSSQPHQPQEGTTEYFLQKMREGGGVIAPLPSDPMTDVDVVPLEGGGGGDPANAPVVATQPVSSVRPMIGCAMPPIVGLAKLDRGEPMSDRASYIPLRVSAEERALLHLLNGALEVSEYTDKVDVTSAFGYGWSARKSKKEIVGEELTEMFLFMMGLSVCDNINNFHDRIQNKKHLQDHEKFIRRVFEVGRRYKICNPQKMRVNYGKMMWMLQDTIVFSLPEDMSCVRPLQTVRSFLAGKSCLDLLEDSQLPIAAAEVVQDGRSRERVNTELAAKRDALAYLKFQYASKLTSDDIELVVSSISDANSFLASNRLPVDRMIYFLTTLFDSDKVPDPRHSLEIRYGKGGSKLSHDHHTQFTFVHQSLVLWREIMHEMYKLWICTENDLLSDRSRYQLWNTGQGLNRVQSAPHVGQQMHRILARVQSEVRGWVGLSVVHLGDRDVPNALVFIDKYLQVPRILAPIVKVVETLPDLYEQPQLRAMIDKNFGSLENLRKDILTDYFRHGFDGSGSDGGSCIDGRLTSSWNWCSLIEKKSFGHIFNLAGFQGFDGDFRK